MREITENKTSLSLIGKFGEKSRRWKGDEAGYVAKHIWISKHYGKASKCEFNQEHIARRYEWANISGLYKRDVSDYMQLCPSCHRKLDARRIARERGNGKEICKHGHEFTKENTYIDSRGYRNCKLCKKEANERIRRKNATS